MSIPPKQKVGPLWLTLFFLVSFTSFFCVSFYDFVPFCLCSFPLCCPAFVVFQLPDKTGLMRVTTKWGHVLCTGTERFIWFNFRRHRTNLPESGCQQNETSGSGRPGLFLYLLFTKGTKLSSRNGQTQNCGQMLRPSPSVPLKAAQPWLSACFGRSSEFLEGWNLCKVLLLNTEARNAHSCSFVWNRCFVHSMVQCPVQERCKNYRRFC